MLNWSKEFIGSEILSKMIEGGLNKLTDKLEEHELRRIVADFDSRFKAQMENAALDEEIDLEGIQLYVEKELLGDILNCLLIRNSTLRKKYREQVLEIAYAESGANTHKKKQAVNKYLDTVWSMIDAVTDKQLDSSVRVQLNLLDEAMEEHVRQVENDLRREIMQVNADFLNTNSFAYMIDQIEPKEKSTNAFHYLNPDIGFWGREKEMQALECFLNDSRDLLYMGIVAPGGCGKSKLVHEFVQQHKFNPEWEMQYLGKGQIERLLTFADYRYPRNLLLIVDYAGLYAKQLGDWLYHVSRIQSRFRPTKIRLLLLERDRTVEIEHMTIPPAWKRELHGTGERENAITKLRYKCDVFPGDGVLQPLADDAVIQLMQQYSQRNGQTVSDEVLQQILGRLKDKENERIMAARPLMAMFMVDAYLRGQPVFSWDNNGILEHFIERTEDQWERLCKHDTELKNSISNCVLYATMAGQLSLENGPEYLNSDINRLQTLGDEEYFSVICGINQTTSFDNIILPMEPDIVGEYYLFWKMQKMVLRKEKMRRVMEAAWSNTDCCFAVFARSIHDYGKHSLFADFYLQHLDVLMPPDRNELELAVHSRLLHMMLITFAGSKRESVVAYQLRDLYRKYPQNLAVIENYAAMLMLDFKNHFGNFEDQDANVREINSLRLANRNSEYLKMIYGKSLYNQIVSYVQLKARHKNPEFRQACTERIDKFCSELTALHKQNPDNGTIFRSLMMSNMMLRYPGAQD